MVDGNLSRNYFTDERMLSFLYLSLFTLASVYFCLFLLPPIFPYFSLIFFMPHAFLFIFFHFRDLFTPLLGINPNPSSISLIAHLCLSLFVPFSLFVLFVPVCFTPPLTSLLLMSLCCHYLSVHTLWHQGTISGSHIG